MAIRRRQDGCYCVDMAGWVDPFRREDEPRHRSILRLLDLFRDQQGVIAGFHWAGPGNDRHYVCFSDVRGAESFAAYIGMEPVVTEYDDADPAGPANARRGPPGDPGRLE
ncbi:hypothetical protein [Plastoroseomonas hellenica]|uniref:hypothetical protein n=1 Tax=Plastoroseomonas hellenica TaxID=2687306 RepID=UPI001BA8318C|nr:hypothetical protein [Plastoroseomonas hellenica]MBR0647021.1 hypothetical protein [Plastoroseomonas hellenica]